MDRPKTATANKTDPGHQDHTQQLSLVPSQVGEVQRQLSEAAQPQRTGNSTAAMGLLPQGPPDHPQKQQDGQQLQGARGANKDEGGHCHNAIHPSKRQKLPMHETVRNLKCQAVPGPPKGRGKTLRLHPTNGPDFPYGQDGKAHAGARTGRRRHSKRRRGGIRHNHLKIFNRSGVAGAVLQTPS